MICPLVRLFIYFHCSKLFQSKFDWSF